nr:RHS repeat-associated core domain-containing protein [Methylopila jiangsuensis]
MTSKTYNGGTTDRILVTWNGVASGNKGRGRLTRVTDAGGASDFRYDARGNVLSETRTISGTVYATAYTWDLADRLTSITYPSGRVVTYQRDALGRVTGVTTKANASAPVQTLASGVAWRPMAGYASSASGPLGPDLDWGLAARNAVPVTDGSGMNAGTAAQIASLPHAGTLTQDVLQTLTYGNGYTYWKNFTQDNELYQSIVEDSSATVMNAGLARSDGTNVTQIWDALNASETQYFAYSPANRLSGAWGAYGTHAWTYDANGNRRTETKNGVATTWAYPTTSNRLTSVTQGSTTLRSFTYHNDGAIKRDTRSGVAYDYSSNRAGRIGIVTVAGVAQSSQAYDAFNRLRVRTLTSATATPGTIHYVWDIFGHIVAEHVVGAGMAREYVWLGDTPLAVVDAAAGLYYVHVDHLDRPALMSDASKAVVWRASYEPFGAVRSITGPASLDLRFPGQWFQLEAGLAYNWNRHYDPTLGRYTQPDPLGFVDGPNVYGYVGQSPIRRVDPRGLDTTLITTYDYGMGSHSAVHVDRGAGGEPYLYDPAGSYPNPSRGSGDLMTGGDANLDDFIDFHKRNGSEVTIDRVGTSTEDEAEIARRMEEIGGAAPFMCASSVSRVLDGIGPFKGLGGIDFQAHSEMHLRDWSDDG